MSYKKKSIIPRTQKKTGLIQKVKLGSATPKEEVIQDGFTLEEMKLAHKLVVLCNLVVETLDEMDVHKPSLDKEHEEKVKDDFRGVSAFCERLIEVSFSHKQVKESTYITDLSNKVNYIINKHFEIL